MIFTSPVRIILCLLILLNFRPEVSKAAVGVAVANSNWGTASTWSFNGVNRVPNCGDTVSIPAGRVVTVASQNDYTSCVSPLSIIVGGTLQFSNGNKLQLPCNSTVNILSGGLVKKSTAGGGNSTFIEICGTVEWKAADGDLYGPRILGGNTLPVTLLFFKAKSYESFVELTWATGSEINNDYFTIERSIDAENFTVIATVSGAGNSSVKQAYLGYDRDRLNQLCYYRLKQTDYDGMSSYSDIIAINSTIKSGLQIVELSAAATNTLSIRMNDSEGGLRQFSIFNLQGKSCYRSSKIVGKGLMNLLIDDCHLSPGIYTLRITGNDLQESKIFLIN